MMNNFLLSVLSFFIIYFLSISCSPELDRNSYVWEMETDEELEYFGNDGSGASYQLSDDVSFDGTRSVKVIPSGTSNETKIALPIRDERLSMWKGNEQMVMNVYLPAENHLNPTRFFLGMSDVTGGDWDWKGGLFRDDNDLQDGWNEIVFTLPESMRDLEPDRDYTIFLAFSTYMVPAEDGIIMPLYENFYVDGIRMN